MRAERIKELLDQRAAINKELAEIAEQMRAEKQALNQDRKRKKKDNV